MDPIERVSRCTGFQWDEGNLLKSWERHGVAAAECEQVFFNQPLLAAPDVKHASREPRFCALGHTDAGRFLFVVFTIRRRLIRVISARDMSRRERGTYQSS
jgi:uncharacterized DUF497 family protein